MRIAFVVHDLNRSWGHSRYVAELAERFSAQHDVHVFANTFAVDDRLKRVVLHRIPAWRLNAFTTILSFLVTASFESGRGFDIVHSQGLCGMTANVVTAHQCNWEWFQSRKRQEKRLALKEHVFGNVVSTLEHVGYRTFRRGRVIAISKRIAEDLKRHYRCQAPIDLIHHGTDTNTFRPGRAEDRRFIRQTWGIEGGKTVFLFVGDLRKGARQCILAMREFPDRKLVFVSRSPVAEWQELAKTEQVVDRVVFAGPTENVQHAYAGADAFLCPTPYDPFALVVSEAMCSGLPVVVSAAAGAAELIQHGKNGLVLENPRDVEELTRHMKRLCADPVFAKELGQQARLSQEQQTWDHVAAETMRVYERQLATERIGETAPAQEMLS